MGPKTRVLVVDDAVVIRKLVTEALASDPSIDVVGTAPNGRIALQKIPQVNPDLITLDIEMPEMDGLETLVAIRKTWPTLPVVMFSTLTERGAAATLDALSRGASDYVTKPANVGGINQGLQRVRDELIPKIHALCAPRAARLAPARPTGATPPATPTVSASSAAAPAGGGGTVGIVAIGVSTGGPNALAVVIPALPANLGVPIAITQHMPPMFTRMLAARLDSANGVRVVEGEDGMLVEPGKAYVAPGDYHMEFRRKGSQLVVHLTQAPPENSCRPAVDVMFRSIVALFGKATLGVVLTGMGQDGLRGCELVRAAGGQVVVQDEASSVVWGMPGFVARAGLAHVVAPLDHVSVEITRRVRQGALVPARLA